MDARMARQGRQTAAEGGLVALQINHLCMADNTAGSWLRQRDADVDFQAHAAELDYARVKMLKYNLQSNKLNQQSWTISMRSLYFRSVSVTLSASTLQRR